MSSSDYRVNVGVFEGPLDLLLYLIKKNDLDVYDIPIAFVLEEYMSYLDTLKELDIDLAGDFLLMAAELAHIKSQILLPEEPNDGDEEEVDPRADLVKRLLEYQQFKAAGEEIAKGVMLGRDVYVPLSPERMEAQSDGPIECSVYDLAQAFSGILKRISPERYHEVAVDRISINDRIYQIVDLIKARSSITLEELLPPEITRYDVVITFLAILEMARLGIISLFQAEPFGGVYIQCKMQEVGEEEVLKLVEQEAEDRG